MSRYYVFSLIAGKGAGEQYVASDHEAMVERTVRAVQDHLIDHATVYQGGPSGFPVPGGRETFVAPIPTGDDA